MVSFCWIESDVDSTFLLFLFSFFHSWRRGAGGKGSGRVGVHSVLFELLVVLRLDSHKFLHELQLEVSFTVKLCKRASVNKNTQTWPQLWGARDSAIRISLRFWVKLFVHNTALFRRGNENHPITSLSQLACSPFCIWTQLRCIPKLTTLVLPPVTAKYHKVQWKRHGGSKGKWRGRRASHAQRYRLGTEM